jgi:hypothetical protein
MPNPTFPYSDTARSQGWDIFECNRADRQFEIERDDEAEIFENDPQAVEFVREKFLEKDPVAHAAARFLRESAPVEFQDVFADLLPVQSVIESAFDMRALPVKRVSIVNIEHPEWGPFGVDEDCGLYYEIRGSTGGRTLSKDEAVRFWKVA